MKERLLEFLRAENKSSAQLAEEIGVQPSGISHILSGRNNPSLDFVLKMLEKYKFLSTEWLLFGKGTMYKDLKMQSLFDEADISGIGREGGQWLTDVPKVEEKIEEKIMIGESLGVKERNKSSVTRIVMFYDDKSFEEYTPHG